MRKSELTLDQANLRASIVNRLLFVNWKDMLGDWYFDDNWSEEEIYMTYKSQHMNLEFKYCFEDSVCKFTLTDKSEGELSLAVYPGEKIGDFVDFIIGLQDELSANNYKSIIRQLVNSYPLTYYDPGDGGELTKVE